jgi:hypothetical protein
MSSLVQDLVKNTVLVFLILYTAVYHLNHCLKDLQNDISWSIFLPLEGKQNFIENVCCAQNRERGENLFIGLVDV